MVTSYTGDGCPMVQLFCPEQITIPQSFPNILKTFAKAAIRTQPYDILRWSAAYFRSLEYNAPPPAKIRLERECRKGTLTKGYLKVLVTQVGKGFFISRCLLQERWKALCLWEDDLLKYLSLCRMLNWPQVHWLKLLAVMIGSLNETPQDTMTMVCELLTDDVDGGLARIPYWMFKICYTFVAQLECSQEQCFVNGQLVLPWGDLEAPTQMESLPRVLSAALLKNTIIASCKAKFDKPHYGECDCPMDSSSGPEPPILLPDANLDDPKEFLSKCEDFDTIMHILQNAQPKPVCEDDFKEEHYISERQLQDVKKIEENHNVQELLNKESLHILREVGPPWTWLHAFTTSDCNTASYNFIHQEPIPSDNVSLEFSLESLKSLIQDAIKDNKCDIEQMSSIISYVKLSEGIDYSRSLELNGIVEALEQAEATGKKFTNVDQLIEHVKAKVLHSVDEQSESSNCNMDQQKVNAISSKESLEKDKDYYCCESTSTLNQQSGQDPPPQYYCSLRAITGIGPSVSQKTVDDFLAFMQLRSRSQRGLISPRNFKEERCPSMVDIKHD